MWLPVTFLHELADFSGMMRWRVKSAVLCEEEEEALASGWTREVSEEGGREVFI